MEAKTRALLVVSDGGFPAHFSPAAETVKAGGALFQTLAMGCILLPPGRVGNRAPVAQEIGVPVLATADATILRFEPANAALHVGVRCGESPAGRSTAPGRGKLESTRKNSVRHSRSSSDKEPWVSCASNCARHASKRLPTVALLTTSSSGTWLHPGGARLLTASRAGV